MTESFREDTDPAGNQRPDSPPVDGGGGAMSELPTHQECIDHLESEAPGYEWENVTLRNATCSYLTWSEWRNSIVGESGVLGELSTLAMTDDDFLRKLVQGWLIARLKKDPGNLKQLESLEKLCFVLDEAQKIHASRSASIADLESIPSAFGSDQEPQDRQIVPSRTSLQVFADFIRSAFGSTSTQDETKVPWDSNLRKQWQDYIEVSNSQLDDLLRKIRTVEDAWETFNSHVRESGKEGTSALQSDTTCRVSGEILARKLADLAATCGHELKTKRWEAKTAS